MVLFFFFKQKTASEMRISDWSSDVCSSDLLHRRQPQPAKDRDERARRREAARRKQRDRHPQEGGHMRQIARGRRGFDEQRTSQPDDRHHNRRPSEPHAAIFDPLQRSEEHTSELQSLMRISYAVFCLKKKNKQ